MIRDSTKKRIIGSNFSADSENWRKVLANPHYYVSVPQLGRKAYLVRRKVEEALKIQRIGFAWSGGKDSIVLRHILRNLEFHYTCFATYTNLENIYFPSTKAWLDTNTPKDTELVDIGFDWERIKKIAFPNTSVQVKCWLSPKWKIFKRVQKEQKLDWMLFGRRRDDGNKIIHEKFKAKDGTKTWCPLMSWSNEEVAAYIAVHAIGLPPDYMVKSTGFKYGLCPWPLTDMETVRIRWPEIIGKLVTEDGEIIV